MSSKRTALVLAPLLMLGSYACTPEERDTDADFVREVSASITEIAGACAAAISAQDEPAQIAIAAFTDEHFNDITAAVYVTGKPAAAALTFAPGESISLDATATEVETAGLTYRHASIEGPDPEPGFEKQMVGQTSLRIGSEIDNQHCTFGGPRTTVKCAAPEQSLLFEGWRCTPSFVFTATRGGEAFEIQAIDFAPNVVKHAACRGETCVSFEPQAGLTVRLSELGTVGSWPVANVLDRRLVKLANEIAAAD